MNPCSPNSDHNFRTFIVSLLVYAMLTIQLAPMAGAANGSALGRATAKAPDVGRESSGEPQQKVQFAPLPAPVPRPTVPAGGPPNIVATKTDNRTPAQPAAPGDTINYTVVITNNGVTAATGVVLTDTIDANTTLVPNSIVSTPIANTDTYNVIGNVRIQPNAAQGLLANDFNPDAGNATGITASGPTTTTQNGNLTINADGSFSYNPAPGFTGTDTFTYTLTVTATGKTDTATVTLLVGNGTSTPGSNVIWFINSAAAAGGDGRLTNPFNCYTGPDASCFSTTATDEIGDNIFLFSGAHVGGNTLLNNQKLIGQGASATLASIAGLTLPTGSDALPATGGASPTINTAIAATVGVPLGQGNTLRGFTVGDVTGTKISGNTFGTLTVGNNTTPDVILNGNGRALGLTTGTFAATSGFVSVATTSSVAQGIQLTGVAGTVSFGSTTVSGATTQGILVGTTTADINFGNTTVSGGTDGVSFQNNSAGTRTCGTLGVSGGSGSAFIHGAGGGNVTVSGAATLSSAGDAISISAPGATNVVNFQAATNATRTAAGGNGVNWAGTAGASLTFSALTIQTNAGTGLNATVGGAITVTNGTGTINNTTQAAPAIVANGITLNANFSAINSSGGTNGVSLTNVTGISNFGGGQLTGTALGATFLVSGGTATLTYAGNISQGNNAPLLSISGGHSGTITFNTGLLLATGGTGAQFDNADGTYNFNGQISCNGGDAGVDILNGSDGTFSFANSANISNPSGVAFNVNGGTASVTYNGSILKNNNGAATVSIVGHATGTITFQTNAITVGNGTGLLFSNADGTYNLSVASGNTILMGGDAGIDIIGGSSGTFAFGTGVGIVNPSGVAYTETGSTANVTYAGGIDKTNNANSAVSIGSKTGGTTTFSGGINASTTTANAINLATNAGGTINFTGGLNLTTTSGVGFNATGGGTVNATQNNTTTLNTVSTTTGTGVNISTPTNIGGSGVTFRSVTVNNGASNSATNAIILNGTTGTFLVSGDASQTGGFFDRDGSGGTINRTTGHSVLLTDAQNVTLRQMNITNTAVGGGCPAACTADGVRSTGGGSIVLSAVTLQNLGGNGWNAANITGTNAINNNSLIQTWNTATTSGVTVANTTTNFSGSFTVDRCTFSTSATGADGFLFDVDTAAGGGTVTVTNSEFTLIDQDAVQINHDGSGTLNAIVQNSNFHDADATGGDGNNTVVLVITAGDLLNFNISNNAFTNLSRLSANSGVLQVLAAGGAAGSAAGARLNGTISNNTLTNPGFVSQRRGIMFAAEASAGDHGSHAVAITNNSVQNFFLQGIYCSLTSVAGFDVLNTNLTITGNQVGNISPVGQNGGDSGTAMEFETAISADGSGGQLSANALFQNNTAVSNNSSGIGDTLDINNTSGVTTGAGNSSTLNLTVLGNTLTQSNGAGQVFEARNVLTATATMCIDLNSGNTSPNNAIGGTGGFRLDNDAGSYTIEGLGAATPSAFLGPRNQSNGASPATITALGTIGSSAGCANATLPTGPAPIDDSAIAIEDHSTPVSQGVVNQTSAGASATSMTGAGLASSTVLPVLITYLDGGSATRTDSATSLIIAAPMSAPIVAPKVAYRDWLMNDVRWVITEEGASATWRSAQTVQHAEETAAIKTAETKRHHAAKVDKVGKVDKGDKGGKGIVPLVANFPLTIGTLQPGKSVTVTFSVTVNNPLPGGTTQVSNQGTVSGSNFASVLTDDPDVAGTNNPTITGITGQVDIFARDARTAEPTSGTSNMLFTVALSIPAPGAVSVNFQTADEPPGAGKAVAGTCGAGGDYVTTSGTVNFTAGQRLQTIAVPICSDVAVEPDETFLVNLSTPVGGNIVDGQAIGTITAANTPGDAQITEIRTSGPGGTADEFVELYNNSDLPVTVQADDASPGVGLFKMGAACTDTPILIGTIPNGTVVPARGHYLFVGSTFSLGAYAAGDSTLTADIENDRNLGFFSTTDPGNLSTDTRLDAVGFGTNTGGNCDLLREGTNLQPAAGSTAQHSFVRKLATGLPQDTNDNAADFVIVATDTTIAVGSNPLPLLGAPGPENLATPIQRNTTIKASLLDTAAASSAPPNRVRDNTSFSDTLTPSAPNGGAPATNPYTLGTLVIRRKFTNNTGAAVTRLRFRIVDITSTNAPPGGAGQSDVRALSSLTSSVATGCCGTVTVQGLTLEQPPTQARGGGLSSSLAAGTVTLGTPLANGASLNVNLLLGVATAGSFRFFINVEALP